MALSRRDTCQHAMKAGVFVSCRMTYDGAYSGKTQSFGVLVLAADLPGNATPSDAQVRAIADPRATALYSAWKATVDAKSATVTQHIGQAGTVVA